jgi:lysophospholipase L1-like esterase
MRSLRVAHPIRQLFLLFAAFVAVVLLLEAEGLANWANHLEIGPLHTAAAPVTAAIAKALHPLGIDPLRQHVLASLARAGWSDDAALLAAANAPPPSDLPRIAGAAALASANAAGPSACPASLSATATSRSPLAQHLPLPGAGSVLAANVPHSTVLAPLAPVEPGKPRVVALAGDSMMAVGLSATLMRQAAGDKNLRIVKAFRSGTGLARPEVFNWMDEYPAMLGSERPDVVIVAIGANDGQGFVVDSKVLPYGSPDWLKVYQDRLANYVAMVGATGARVVWIGLPPMRIPAYNDKIATINRIAYTVVSQSPQADWWNPVSFVGDDQGNFREFLTLKNGQTMRLRSADGIHLSDEGAGLLTAVLMKWLDPPPAQISAASPAPVSAPPARPAPASKPKRRPRRGHKRFI